jgi:hypothetical protein
MTVSLCFHVLTTLARAALDACPEELGRHLQVVVTTIVTFAQGSNVKANLKKQVWVTFLTASHRTLPAHFLLSLSTVSFPPSLLVLCVSIFPFLSLSRQCSCSTFFS